MPLIVFLAVLVLGLSGAMAENAYHGGDCRAAGALSGFVYLLTGLVGFQTIAEKSIVNLLAGALAWSIAMGIGSYWRAKTGNETGNQ